MVWASLASWGLSVGTRSSLAGNVASRIAPPAIDEDHGKGGCHGEWRYRASLRGVRTLQPRGAWLRREGQLGQCVDESQDLWPGAEPVPA